MNEIEKIQNQPEMIRIVRAFIVIYNRSKQYQAIALLVTMLLPILGGIAAVFKPDLKPFIAIFALSFGFIDALLIDRSHKVRMKTAAKLQEEFDCHVLSLEWNKFLVGRAVDPEDVARESSCKLSASDERRLTDWYPTVAKELPIHLARIICQRTNLWYDRELRTRYRNIISWSIALIVIASTVVSSTVGFTVTSFVITILVPISPALNWAIREYYRQTDAMKTLENLKSEIEKLWDKALGNATVEEVTEASRELQDAIFAHRASSPLIFNWLYKPLRPKMESNMNSGAEYWVKQAKTAKGIN
ncbi:S-4TM family putative pore-forming effector [Methylosarcina fibrata]|uniref:S-4TM family putative pore-forming effector n=1 Tax=Methylosarcina fibrata TaxID=105972 RepID=UPI000380C3FD|nr:S-4TM family putative pore-forming effector [Methylosarcina fibrata]